MRKEKLLKNMADQVKEAQIKLGYAAETVRLYYPVASLNGIMETDAADGQEMLALLRREFGGGTDLGELKFDCHGGRIEVSIPPEGARWVHEHVETPAFLEELIDLFRTNHACTLEEICGVFERCGGYVCEKMPEGSDFDYAIHLKDRSVDEYYYCIHMEMGHTIYHRFSEQDYRELL
ncbi:MAG: DUF3877 family protein [Eubacteriales bacterium]|nr:DUF3877 family protein [Eubacteriales bacterium]